MLGKTLFLRWLVINVVVIFALIFVGLTWWSDISSLGTGPKFGAGVLLAYAGFALYLGRLMWDADIVVEEYNREGSLDSVEIAFAEELLHDGEHVWFGVSMLPMLGMVGTVTGFLIVMVSGFGHLQGTITPEDVSALVKSVGNGSGTALVSTLVGILGSLLLAIQHHMFDHSVSELVPDDPSGT